ncbi:hypothetical protein [Desulfovibrio sp. Dsv1]|uniref:hypothetical protein n=1 Tax=uncultured Desulfovibrio sp. TaxID=167968 RepID=UPI0003B50C69
MKPRSAVGGRVVAAIGADLLSLVGFGRENGPDFPQSPAVAGMARKPIFPGRGGAPHKFR